MSFNNDLNSMFPNKPSYAQVLAQQKPSKNPSISSPMPKTLKNDSKLKQTLPGIKPKLAAPARVVEGSDRGPSQEIGASGGFKPLLRHLSPEIGARLKIGGFEEFEPPSNLIILENSAENAGKEFKGFKVGSKPWDSPTPAGGRPEAIFSRGTFVGGQTLPKCGTFFEQDDTKELEDLEAIWYLI